ncbi:5141_t:CDS:1, partial [Cetraspora pellucida]
MWVQGDPPYLETIRHLFQSKLHLVFAFNIHHNLYRTSYGVHKLHLN